MQYAGTIVKQTAGRWRDANQQTTPYMTGSVEIRTSWRSCVTRQDHYTTVRLIVVAATSLLCTPKQLTAGRCCTKLVIIETHDLAMTNHS